jgi:hypothetical protein
VNPRAAAWAALLGAACGFAGGMVGGRLVGGDAGRGRGADLERLEAGTLAARAELAASVAALSARLDALEASARAEGGTGSAELAAAVRGLGEDVAKLRDAVARDLRQADLRIGELERRVDQLAALAALAPPPPGPRTPTEEDEAAWLNLARDADPLRRFSALAMLGRVGTDRSVRASTEALHDSSEIVVWQAVRNLGAYGDRSAARDLAALLRHEAVAVRHAAHEALVKLGAPDAHYVASDPPDTRRAATETIERWAADLQ